jgi:hypothetical protein
LGIVAAELNSLESIGQQELIARSSFEAGRDGIGAGLGRMHQSGGRRGFCVRLGVGKMAGQVEASLRPPVVDFSVRALTEMRPTQE